MNSKPQRLLPGDEVGIIAPAGPVTREEVRASIDFLVSRGYEVLQARHLYENNDYLAGDDDSRLEDLHYMFSNGDVKAVFCARGGYGTLRLLDRIDYEIIGRNPKIFMGYSDITALLLALYKKTGLVSFHGPVVREFAKNSRHVDQDSLLSPTSDGEALSLDLSGGDVISGGNAEGILLGGNLSVISHMAGTDFLPSMEGVILFLEDKGESLYRIDRMLTHLRLAGVLDGLAGLVLGDFINCGEYDAVMKLFADITSCMDIPVSSGMPAGHGDRNITVPVGLQYRLDTAEKKLTAKETCFRE